MEGDGSSPDDATPRAGSPLPAPTEAPQEIRSERAPPALSIEYREAALFFRGPVPPPGAMRAYEEITPGAADRILTMAENEAAHRQRTESRGQLFGFLLGLVPLVGAIALLLLEKAVSGLAALVSALAVLCAIFVINRRSRRDSLAPAPPPAGQHGPQG